MGKEAGTKRNGVYVSSSVREASAIRHLTPEGETGALSVAVRGWMPHSQVGASGGTRRLSRPDPPAGSSGFPGRGSGNEHRGLAVNA